MFAVYWTKHFFWWRIKYQMVDVCERKNCRFPKENAICRMKIFANISGYTIVTNVWTSIAVGWQQLSGCPQDHQILPTWNLWSVASSILFHFHELPIHEYHISDERLSSTKSWNIEILNIPCFAELCIFCVWQSLSASSSYSHLPHLSIVASHIHTSFAHQL